MSISKFVIVVGSSAVGMNALSKFVRQLKTGMNPAVLIVNMVAYSKGNAAGNKRKFSGIMIEWLYMIDKAGVIIPMGKFTKPKSKGGLIF